MIHLPESLLAEIDDLVRQGVFPDRDVAVSELVRVGLSRLRSRGPGPGLPPRPDRPPNPPGYQDPGDDRPIEVNPWDTKWVE